MNSLTKALYGWLLAAILLELMDAGRGWLSTIFRVGIAIMILIAEKLPSSEEKEVQS